MVLATEHAAIRELAATLASSLAAAGRAGTLIWVSENANRPLPPPPTAGVDVLTISAAAPGRAWLPDYPLLNLTRQIAPTLREFEVVYGLTSGHPLMHAICEGRHAPGAAPYFVAVLNSVLAEPREADLSPGAIARQFGESYVLANCDLILCLGTAGREQLAHLGVAPPASRILSSEIRMPPTLFDKVETQARAVADARSAREKGASVGPGFL